MRQWLQKFFAMRATGISSLATFVTALVWFLWPGVDWKFEPEPFGLLFVAFVAFFVSELAKVTHELSKHDQDLYGRIFRCVSSATMREMRDYDLGNPFDSDMFDELKDLRRQFGSTENSFKDRDLRLKFKDLMSANNLFLNTIAQKTFPLPDRSDMLRISIRTDANGKWLDSTWATIEELNDLATKLYAAFEELTAAYVKKAP